MMRLRQSGIWVTLGSAMLSACGGSDGASAPVQGVVAADTSGGQEDLGSTPEPDVAVSDDIGAVEDTGPTIPNQFTYDTKGSDGQACKDSCSLTVDVGASVELAVRYLDGSGNPIPEIGVRWSADNEAAIKLGAKTTYTDAAGRAVVKLDGVAAAGSVIIRAAIADDVSGADLPFTVAVSAGATNAASVTFAYTGNQNVTSYEVRLYRVADSNATCATVDPDAPGSKPTPTVSKAATAGQTVTFPTLPGLVEGNTESWLAQVVGPPTAPSIEGCTPFDAMQGTTAEVSVQLSDLALRYAGKYSITSRLDLYTGLDGTAGSAIAFLVQLFDSPGGTALEAACKNPSSSTLILACNWLVDSNGQPSGAGIALAKKADEAFYALIANFLGDNVAFAGDSIASLLKEMRFGSSIECGEPTEPVDGDLAFTSGTVAEVWSTASYSWKFGKQCPIDDENCGFEAVKLSDIFGANPTASPDASVSPSNGLSIAVHEVQGFDYGQLINYLVENRVLPSLFGDGKTPIVDPEGYCDGEVTPKADTYGKVISMIFGDECCVLYDDCCYWFSQKDAVKPYDIYPGAMEALCGVLIPAADSFLRKTVQDVGGNLVIGTDVPCQALDASGDRKVDALGSKAAPCTWDATVGFPGGNFAPENAWTGVK